MLTRAIKRLLPGVFMGVVALTPRLRAETALSFTNDVAPILVAKCVICHSPEKSKGHYQLHTFEALLKAGESKAAPIQPGSARESHLFQLITATDEADRMPQKGDPLAPVEVQKIEKWISQGARFDGPDPKAALASLVPRRGHVAPPAVYARALPVLAVAFNPAGTELAVNGYNEVTFWEPSTGKLLRRLTNVTERVQALAYSPDGAWLAVAGGVPGRSGEVALYSLKLLALDAVLGSFGDVALAVTFDRAGQQLAAGITDNSIRIYDLASRRERLVIQQHADWVLALDFSPDGRRLASASRDRSARVYNTENGSLDATYMDHEAPVNAIAFSGKDERMISAGRDKRILIWKSQDSKKVSEISKFDGEIYRVAVTEKHLFCVTGDGSVRQYALADNRLVQSFAGHKDSVYALSVDEKQNRLATGSYDGEVRIWDIGSGNGVSVFKPVP